MYLHQYVALGPHSLDSIVEHAPGPFSRPSLIDAYMLEAK
jgi:hypothetical protein